MMGKAYLINDEKAWVKRKNGPDEVVRVLFIEFKGNPEIVITESGN